MWNPLGCHATTSVGPRGRDPGEEDRLHRQRRGLHVCNEGSNEVRRASQSLPIPPSRAHRSPAMIADLRRRARPQDVTKIGAQRRHPLLGHAGERRRARGDRGRRVWATGERLRTLPRTHYRMMSEACREGGERMSRVCFMVTHVLTAGSSNTTHAGAEPENAQDAHRRACRIRCTCTCLVSALVS